MLGVGTAVSKRAVTEIPPLTLLPIQLGVSLVVLAVLMRRRGLSFRGGRGAPLLGRLGLLNPGLAYALGLLGLASISASLSVLLWAVEPLMILVMAAWFLHERVTPALVGAAMDRGGDRPRGGLGDRLAIGEDRRCDGGDSDLTAMGR